MLSCFSSINSYFDQWHVQKQSLKTTLSSIVEQNQNNCWRKNCWTSHLLRLKYVTKKKTTFKTKQFAHLNLSGLNIFFTTYISLVQFLPLPEYRASFRCPSASVLGSNLRISIWLLHPPCLGRLDVWPDKEESISGWSKSCRGRRQTNRLADDTNEFDCRKVFVKTKEIKMNWKSALV